MARSDRRSRLKAVKAPVAVPPVKTPLDQHAADIEAAVHKMSIDHVQCRDFGHNWRPYTAYWRPKENCYESQLICQRCSTLRTRWLSRTGAQVSGGYDYAEGYLVKGLGRMTGTDRDVIRLQSVLAVLADVSNPATGTFGPKNPGA